MKKTEKKHSDSLFKRYFIQITATVLFCLMLTGLTILIFSLNFWKTGRFASLKDDALSLTQSVDSIFKEDNISIEHMDRRVKKEVEHLMTTLAKSELSEIYLTNPEGTIFMRCSAKDTKRTALVFPQGVLQKINNNEDVIFEYKGKIDKAIKEQYFVVSISFEVAGEKCYIVCMQPETVAYLPYVTAFTRIMVTVGIVVVLISFIASYIVSMQMARPLKIISDATEHYAEGDFSVKIKASQIYTELTELMNSVNKMADSLALLEESRSSFVANVSHELKTPMTTISGFIDGILDGTIPEKDQQKYLHIVSDEVKRLSRLVVAMLNMSKIEAGKLELKKSDFNIREILTRTLLSFEKFIEDKNIEIEGCEDLEDVHINADEALINQVIYNLIDNAVKFTPEGGTITLSLKQENGKALFSIRNTGKGISPKDCGLIFDRFYKVDKSRGLDSKSFGMGLYIVKNIIELHKGTINLNSIVNKYTEFNIKLPLSL